MLRFLPVMYLTAALLLGCSGEPDPADNWEPIDPEAMTATQNQQQTKAHEAKDALFTALKDRLTEVIEAEGPASAIEVCKEEAPAIARRVAQQHRLAIGRTSQKLRNPENAPPAWVTPLIKAAENEARYFHHRETGELAALLPIRLQPACMVCHGPPDSIPPPVRAQLEKTYPEDEATGFEAGDLRGWVHVRVPAHDEV